MWNSKTRLPPVYSYGIAIILTLLALLASVLLWANIQYAPFMIYFAAVTLSAWRGGLGPGLLCGLLSIINVDFFLLEPSQRFTTRAEDIFLLLSFGLISILISVLQESRLRAEQSLLNIKEELEVILNGVTDGITAQDSSGQTIFANEAAALISGQPASNDLIAPPVEQLRQRFELYDENGVVIPVAELPRNRVFNTGAETQSHFRMRIIGTDEERWLAMKTSPVLDKAGNVRLVVNIFRDVSERHRLQAIQKQTEERLRKVLDTIATFVGVLSPDGTLIEANRSALEGANLQAEDVIGKPFHETYWWSYSTDAQQQLQNAIKQALEGEVVRYDARIRLSAYHYVLLDFTLAPVFDDDGEIEYLIPSGIDVNERTRLELLLVEEQQRLETILNNVPGVVFEGKGQRQGDARPMTYISNYAEKMLGYSPESWMSDPEFWKKVILEDDWESVSEQSAEIYKSGKPGIVRFRCLTKDKRIVYVESHTTVLTDEQGETLGTCGVVMDITDHKYLQDRLKDQTDELKRSNKDLEQFAYVASHDLQEPLRMVTSYLQLIEQRYTDKLDDDAREFIQFAVDGASRMKRLINDLLTYSRVHRDQSDYGILNMEMILHRALDNLKLTIEECDAIITHDLLPEVTAHEGQFLQLFQNLIGNALKFRRDVPLQIHIGVEKQKGAWLFSIQDNGIGIGKEYLERIFVIFQRLHSSTRYSGTGIGLAICKKVIENHGGRIWVESNPGEGTTFYFTIPVLEKRSYLEYGSVRRSGNITR